MRPDKVGATMAMHRQEKKTLLQKVCAFAATIALVQACGTMVGNPKKPGGGGGAEETFKFPTIDVQLPSSVLTDEFALHGEAKPGFALQGVVQKLQTILPSLIHLWSARIDLNIAAVNAAIKVMKDEGINKVGTYKKIGEDDNWSAEVAKSKREGMEFEALGCYKGKRFVNLHWKNDGSRIEATYDYSIFTFTLLGREFPVMNAQTKVDYSKTGDDVVASLATQGNFALAKLLGVDGTNILERIAIRRDKDNTLELTGVNDWATEVSELGKQGDEYLVGRLAADGTGEYVGYHKNIPRCVKGGFDESAADLWKVSETLDGRPGWCLGKKVSSSDSDGLTELPQILTRLEGIGITKFSELEKVEFATELTCPE